MGLKPPSNKFTFREENYELKEGIYPVQVKAGVIKAFIRLTVSASAI